MLLCKYNFIYLDGDKLKIFTMAYTNMKIRNFVRDVRCL